MPLETGNYIANLDDNYPLGGDPISQGDNHINLIKKVLKLTFPGALGNGYAEEITATEAELNYLTGLTTNVATALSDIQGDIATLRSTLPAPVGTRMVFHQAAAPTGWTQDTSYNDHMLRVINTAGGGSGGTDSPILNNKVPSHTHTFSGTTGTDYPDHTHNYLTPIPNSQKNGSDEWDVGSSQSWYTSAGASQRHQHNFSGTAVANAGAADWAPKYLNAIICQKNA